MEEALYISVYHAKIYKNSFIFLHNLQNVQDFLHIFTLYVQRNMESPIQNSVA